MDQSRRLYKHDPVTLLGQRIASGLFRIARTRPDIDGFGIDDVLSHSLRF
jgi:hypothetical protein